MNQGAFELEFLKKNMAKENDLQKNIHILRTVIVVKNGTGTFRINDNLNTKYTHIKSRKKNTYHGKKTNPMFPCCQRAFFELLPWTNQ